MTDDKDTKNVMTPVGRLINQSLFEKEIYTDPQGHEGTPQYKVEMIFENGSTDVELLDAAFAAAAVAKWGAGAEDDYYNEKIISPFKDGDEYAAEVDNGKRDVYAGHQILRAHTIFNKYGDDAPGGIQVFDEKGEEIDPVDRQQIYRGCYGKAALSIGTYVDSTTKANALCVYLSAWGKTDDGDRIATAADYSEVFKPVGREAGEGTTKRRRRAG